MAAGMVKEGKGWVPRPAHSEGIRVSRLLEGWIRREGYSIRAVEEKVGWGSGTLWQVLNGSQPIRISHVAAVVSAIGEDLGEFYMALASEEGKKEDGGAGSRKKIPKKKPAPEREIVPGLSEDEFYEVFKEFVRKWRKGKPDGD